MNKYLRIIFAINKITRNARPEKRLTDFPQNLHKLQQ
jgi:hypothetical protein